MIYLSCRLRFSQRRGLRVFPCVTLWLPWALSQPRSVATAAQRYKALGGGGSGEWALHLIADLSSTVQLVGKL